MMLKHQDNLDFLMKKTFFDFFRLQIITEANRYFFYNFFSCHKNHADRYDEHPMYRHTHIVYVSVHVRLRKSRRNVGKRRGAVVESAKICGLYANVENLI